MDDHAPAPRIRRTAVDRPSGRTLRRVPDRIFQFLRTVGMCKEAREPLIDMGFTAKDMDEGWALLKKISGGEITDWKLSSPEPAQLAQSALDRWTSETLVRLEAAVRRSYPTHAEYLFDEVHGRHGIDAAVAISRLLDRIDALAAGARFVTTRDDDLAALEALRAGGLDAESCARTRAEVAAALASPPMPTSTFPETSDEDLLAGHRWWIGWTTAARAVVKRRDLLARMGIARS